MRLNKRRKLLGNRGLARSIDAIDGDASRVRLFNLHDAIGDFLQEF